MLALRFWLILIKSLKVFVAYCKFFNFYFGLWLCILKLILILLTNFSSYVAN